MQTCCHLNTDIPQFKANLPDIRTSSSRKVIKKIEVHWTRFAQIITSHERVLLFYIVGQELLRDAENTTNHRVFSMKSKFEKYPYILEACSIKNTLDKYKGRI